MASVTHAKVSGAGPAPSPDLVGGDDWDAAHVLDLSSIAGANGGVGVSGGHVQLAGGSANADESLGASLAVNGADEDGGGPVQVYGGNGGAGKRGGPVILTAGTGDSGNDAGASVTVGGGSGTGDAGTITVTTGGLTISVLGGTAAPNAGGGVAANLASLYARDNGGTTGELWVKTGTADTAWTKVV